MMTNPIIPDCGKDRSEPENKRFSLFTSTVQRLAWVLAAPVAAFSFAANANATTLIDEDFSSGASNFTAVAGGTWGVSGGRYQITSPATGSSDGLLGNISVHNTSASGDFTLTAILNLTGTSSWDDAVVVFGYQNTSNYYYVSLNENNDGYTKGIFKVVSGSPTQLADITVTIADDTDYDVEIIRDGSSIVAKVDDTQVASASDSTFTSGKIGFGTYNDVAAFDDLFVEDNSTIAVTGVSVSPGTLALDINDTSDLTETVSPANASNQSVTWSSNNTSVATVNSSGLVTAVGAGSATITVETIDGNFTDTCSVTVTIPVTGVSVSPSTLALDINDTSDLTETVAPANASNQSVTWSSNNTSVATVNSSGLVTAVGAGSATITVETVDGNFTDTCSVTVTIPVTGVSVSPSTLALDINDTSDLTETVAPANASNQSVTWSSNNTSVATVNSSGLVTAVAAGSATITVETVDGNFTDTCSVTVTSGSGPVIDEDFSGGASNFTAVAGGTWSVSSGRYVLSSPASGGTGLLGNIAVCNTTLTGDYTASATVRIVGTGSDWDDTAFVFDYQDSSNFYYVSLNESNDGNTKGVFKVVSGTPTELVDLGSVSIASDTDYAIEVERSSSSIVVRLNSSQIASTTDSTFSGGKVGFGSKNDSGQFDDLLVYGAGTGQVADPSFSPGGGTYSSSQSVTISTTTSGASIRYTTDGSTPTSTSGTVYSSAVSISSTTTLKAIAYKSGMTDSDVTTATYTITGGGGTAYYCDPSSGSMGNPGTSSQPWSTLAAVFAASKTFNDGDIIYLRDGNHGFPAITEDNTADVTITADSGHDPIVNRIDFNGATHWVLDNVKIYTSSTPPESPVLEHPVYPQYNNSLLRITGTSSYITISNCEIYSIVDSSSWDADDWNDNAWTGIYMNSSSHHLTIDGCEVTNTNFGIHMSGDTHDIDIINNTVQNYRGDGLRANCDNLLIENNYILDAYDTNGNHDDMIQGFASENVIIRGNVIINATSSRSLIANAQGIGAFDGWFDDWVVENNIVVTRHYHGISLYGARDCIMSNNTVVFNPIGSGGNNPWIRIDPHKTAGNSSGNFCRNNLVSDVSTMNGTTVSNNIETTSYTSHFVDYANLDLHLKSTSSAIDAGTTSQAPSIDFEGDTRDSNPDVGADEY